MQHERGQSAALVASDSSDRSKEKVLDQKVYGQSNLVRYHLFLLNILSDGIFVF